MGCAVNRDAGSLDNDFRPTCHSQKPFSFSDLSYDDSIVIHLLPIFFDSGGDR